MELIKRLLPAIALLPMPNALLAQTKPLRLEIAPVFGIYHAPQFDNKTQFQLGGRFT